MISIDKLINYKESLINSCTGKGQTVSDDDLQEIRNIIINDSKIYNFSIPDFIKDCMNHLEFWDWISPRYGKYSERRNFISSTFNPIIDFYKDLELDLKREITIKDFNKHIKTNNYIIKTSLGEVKDIKQIGQGGNSIVFSGLLYGENVAIKCLMNIKDNKISRFKAEYFNIVYKFSQIPGIVEMLNYDEIKIKSKYLPIIIMKKYEQELKYKNDISFEEYKTIIRKIMKVLYNIHKEGIIHRDIKPQNILISNNNLVLSDFGIAYYDESIFELTGHTKNSDRLANYKFSAPEQFERGISPSKTMDIYALGQLMHWLAFNNVHKGTNRTKLAKKFNDDDRLINIFDKIIDKCIDNNPESRFQNLDEIFTFIRKRYDKQSTFKIDNNINNNELTEHQQDIFNQFVTKITSMISKVSYEAEIISDTTEVINRFKNYINKTQISKIVITNEVIKYSLQAISNIIQNEKSIMILFTIFMKF